MEKNRLNYTFHEDSKEIFNKFLNTAEAHKNNSFCDIENYNKWKQILKFENGPEQSLDEKTTHIDLTMNEETEKSNTSLKSTILSQRSCNITSEDVTKLIMEIDYSKAADQMPRQLLNIHKYPLEIISEIFEKLSKKLKIEQILLLGESFERSAEHEIIMDHFLRYLLIGRMLTVFKDDIRELFLRLCEKFQQITVSHLVDAINTHDDLETFVFYLVSVTPQRKEEIVRQLVRRTNFPNKLILVLNHLLFEGIEFECLKHLMELLANHKEEYSRDKDYGKFLMKVAQYLGNDLYKVEDDFKHIINQHKSIFTPKLRLMLNTCSEDTMLESQLHFREESRRFSMEIIATRLMPSRTISLCTKLRSPLIKFRYGISRDHKPSTGGVAAENPQKTPTQSGAAIYDFQIPAHWRRKPLTEEECDYINRGGPDNL